MKPEILVEPGCSGLLRADADEIGKPVSCCEPRRVVGAGAAGFGRVLAMLNHFGPVTGGYDDRPESILASFPKGNRIEKSLPILAQCACLAPIRLLDLPCPVG
jgi:hypothetical protein